MERLTAALVGAALGLGGPVHATDGTPPANSVEIPGSLRNFVDAGGNSIHETWRGELHSREHALATPTPEDNRVSWGCVNVSEANFETHVKQLPSGTLVWITPEASE